MANKEKTYIYESPDNGKTVYRREFGKYDKRELVYAKRELGTVTNDDIIKELCETYPNDYDVGRAVRKYYIENIYKK
jgi:hypothetical protein